MAAPSNASAQREPSIDSQSDLFFLETLQAHKPPTPRNYPLASVASTAKSSHDEPRGAERRARGVWSKSHAGDILVRHPTRLELGGVGSEGVVVALGRPDEGVLQIADGAVLCREDLLQAHHHAFHLRRVQLYYVMALACCRL